MVLAKRKSKKQREQEEREEQEWNDLSNQMNDDAMLIVSCMMAAPTDAASTANSLAD